MPPSSPACPEERQRPHVARSFRARGSRDRPRRRAGEPVAAPGLWFRDASDSCRRPAGPGDRGADVVHGVISPPQVALVGFGRIAARPWVVDGTVTARTGVIATLAADHRASDGHAGSRFLATIDRRLQRPEEL